MNKTKNIFIANYGITVTVISIAGNLLIEIKLFAMLLLPALVSFNALKNSSSLVRIHIAIEKEKDNLIKWKLWNVPKFCSSRKVPFLNFYVW